jgi:hypothetical protein
MSKNAIGRKLRYEYFKDDVFRHARVPVEQPVERQEIRVVRYDEWGKKIECEK